MMWWRRKRQKKPPECEPSEVKIRDVVPMVTVPEIIVPERIKPETGFNTLPYADKDLDKGYSVDPVSVERDSLEVSEIIRKNA